MRKCNIKCRHRAMVLEYRDAVFSREAQRESSENMQLEDDEFDEAFPRILFKDWLIALKGRWHNPHFDSNS